MTTTVTVRRVEPAELSRVGELTAQAYLADDLLGEDDDYVAQLRDAAHRAAHATVLVATDAAGTVLGTATLAGHGSGYAEIARAGEAELRMLAVEPAARGRGVGEALARAALAQGLAEAGAVVLSSMPTMHAAHRMYERLGLERVPSRDWPIPSGQVMQVYRAVHRTTPGPA